MKFFCCIGLLVSPLFFWAQNQYEFPIDDINALLRDGSCHVEHSQFDIGSINDVFDENPSSLARSANINPLVITLTFQFPILISGSEILHSYGDGWWSLEAADTEADLDSQSGTYVQLFAISLLTDGVPQLKNFDTTIKRIIRLTVQRTTGDDYVHLNEWQLIDAFASVELTSICVRPSEIWLLPDSEFEVAIVGTDEQGFNYPLQTDVNWNVLNPGVSTIEAGANANAILSAIDTGSTLLSVSWKGLQQNIPVTVSEQFKPMTASTRKVNVALVIIDPRIDAEEGLRFHQRFGWDDPLNLTYALRDSLNSASGGAVDYQIVDVYDETILYTNFQGTIITVDSMYRMFLEPGWTTFHQLEQLGGSIQFDYNGLLAAHDFCTSSDSGEIDEVWVYSMPFTGMYESRLTGEGAFWYNSPPLGGNSCVGQLPIMGFNYERGVAEAMHSFGHRVESAMAQTFGRWDYSAVDKNDWEKFASYDEVVPGEAHCGNIHFPPNGISDYDYENFSDVTSLAENWEYYPYLFQFEMTLNCIEWNCSHLGFMSWWFHHLPHFTCRNNDGILNNWWAYIVDYPEAKALEVATSDCDCDFVEGTTSALRVISKEMIEIYPNPSNGYLTLDLKEMQHQELRIEIYNPPGLRVKRFILEAGDLANLDIQDLPPSAYSVHIYDRRGVMIARNSIIVH